MITIEEILTTYIFKKVVLHTDRGLELRGYIVDVKLPITMGLAIYFLEESKAKRYLAKYNPTWLMPLPVALIERLELLESDAVTEQLMERRMQFYV